MAMFGQDRRRNFIVDKPFQYRATMVGVLYILVVIVCLSLPMINMMRSVDLILIDRSPEMIDLYQKQMRYTMISLGVCLVAISSAWILFSLWRTHKIAGPIVKITRFIHGIAAGDFGQRIKLRSQDELQALAQALNWMSESLEERDQGLKESLMVHIRLAKQELQSNSSPDKGIRALENLVATVETTFASPSVPDKEAETDGEDMQKDLVYS